MIPYTLPRRLLPCIGTGKDGDRAFGSRIQFSREFTATVTGTKPAAPLPILRAIGIRALPRDRS
jgi:hypothetical protein